jgi:GDP-L-fucose synthase
MRVLVTGANGFIGKNLADALESECEVFRVTRDVVDLTDREAVDEFFKDKSFDVVLHCASTGGKRSVEDGPEVFHKNLAMFYNLRRNQFKYGKMINFGSGAELDRHYSIDKDSYFRDAYPLDYYGMAKNIILRLVENEDKCFNIRLFVVFGDNEDDARFIKTNIQKYINKEPIVIHQNRVMDFFYIDDLIELVKFYIGKPYIPEEINTVYSKKYSLLDIASVINELSDYKVDIITEEKGFGFAYVGKSTRLDLLNLPLKGLEQGIKETYNKLK